MKDSTWMKMAKLIADEESKCISRKVGAVIVKNDRIVSTGYNGTPRKQPNCCDVNAHMVHNGECQNFVSEQAKLDHHEWSLIHELHAEHNAIMYSTPLDRDGAVLYSTLQPCYHCSLLIAGSGIKKVVYAEAYPRTPEAAIDVLINAGVEVIHFGDLT